LSIRNYEWRYYCKTVNVVIHQGCDYAGGARERAGVVTTPGGVSVGSRIDAWMIRKWKISGPLFVVSKLIGAATQMAQLLLKSVPL
jgi:hypothetical protein